MHIWGAGLIQDSSFPWVLTLVVPPKKDDSIRITVKRLNRVAVIVKNPNPRNDEVFDA